MFNLIALTPESRLTPAGNARLHCFKEVPVSELHPAHLGLKRNPSPNVYTHRHAHTLACLPLNPPTDYKKEKKKQERREGKRREETQSHQAHATANFHDPKKNAGIH